MQPSHTVQPTVMGNILHHHHCFFKNNDDGLKYFPENEDQNDDNGGKYLLENEEG